MTRMVLYCILVLCMLLSGCAAKKNAVPQPEKNVEATQKALAFQRDGNLKESLKWYMQALESAESGELRNGAGSVLLSGGSPEAALKEFDRALTFMPASADIHANKGTALSLLKRFDDALESFDTALSYAPDHAEALNGKALIELQKNNYESAMVLLVKARKNDPTNQVIRYNTAIAFEASGLLEDAEKTFTEYLKKAPKDAMALNCRGVVRMKLEKYKLANTDFTKAINLSPTTGSYYYNRGLLWQRQLKYEKAITDYTRAVAYTPDNATTYINRGDTYFLLDEKEKGCTDLIKACEMGLCKKLNAYKKINLCTK